MPYKIEMRCTAFEGFRRIASGELGAVARRTKEVIDRRGPEPVLIFDDATSEQLEVDFRGTIEDVLERFEHPAPAPAPEPAAENQPPAQEPPRGPGRPKLGVVAREVTLLPRHWNWLNGQPGGASVALRKLVEEARRANEGKDRIRGIQESAYRFMAAIAGNLPDFEEATRALFAANLNRLRELIAAWPPDVREHLLRLTGELAEVERPAGF